MNYCIHNNLALLKSLKLEYKFKPIVLPIHQLSESELSTIVITNDEDNCENYIKYFNYFVKIYSTHKLYTYVDRERNIIDYDNEADRYLPASWEQYCPEYFKPIASLYDVFERYSEKEFNIENIAELETFLYSKIDSCIVIGTETKNDQGKLISDYKIMTDDEIHDWFIKQIPRDTLVICIADLCRCGTVFDLDFIYSDGWKHSTKNIPVRRNVYSITACSDYEFSLKRNYGYFTAAIHENNLPDKKNILGRLLLNPDDPELYNDIIENVRRIYMMNRISQPIPLPVFQTSNIKFRFRNLRKSIRNKFS